MRALRFFLFSPRAYFFFRKSDVVGLRYSYLFLADPFMVICSGFITPPEVGVFGVTDLGISATHFRYFPDPFGIVVSNEIAGFDPADNSP